MKTPAVRKSITVVLLCITALNMSTASAKDPCKTALCMYGLLTNSERDGCSSAIADHFDIIVFRKKKKIDWNKTAKERLGFTNSCPTADRGKTKEINDKFGKATGG